MSDSGAEEGKRRMMERGERSFKHWFEEGEMDFVKGDRTWRMMQSI